MGREYRFDKSAFPNIIQHSHYLRRKPGIYMSCPQASTAVIACEELFRGYTNKRVMMLSSMTSNIRAVLKWRTISKKSVVSFESHHYALLPWSKWRQEIGRPLKLLTIDYHTDTNDAFQHYGYYARNKNPDWQPRPFALQDEAARLAQLSASQTSSVEAAILDLRHDEHIDAAIQCGILEAAFILAHKSNELSGGLPPDRMVLLGDGRSRSDDDAERRFRDKIIESEFLQKRLAQAAEICRSAGMSDLLATPFVLDIDLDAFNTRQAVAPENSGVFYDLIRRSYAITIAQEPKCVEGCKIMGEELTAPWLEEQLIAHIEQALA